MKNSQAPVKFLNENQDVIIDSVTQIRFEESEPIILKIVKDLKAIISIDTVVRLVIDSNKVSDSTVMLTLPFQIDSEIVYHNIAKLLHDSFIANYLSSDPKTSHFGLAISILEREASSLLYRDVERLIQLAVNRYDIAGQFIRGVEFSVESTETPPLSTVFSETLVKGLDIHLGLDICVYGVSLNYDRIFIPIQTGGKIIEKIYQNIEQMIQHNLVTYDEVNDKHLRLSETLIFKELESIVHRLRYKINTRRKLLANLKENTVYLGRTGDDYQFNLLTEKQASSGKNGTENQSQQSGLKIDEMNLVGHEINVSPDIKKKQAANRSMRSYGAFLENLKGISQSSEISGDTKQKQVIDYGKKQAVSERKPIRFKRSPKKVETSTPPAVLAESAKNVSETRSFTIKSSLQTVKNQSPSLRSSTTSAINTNQAKIDLNKKQDYAPPSTINFSERDKKPNPERKNPKEVQPKNIEHNTVIIKEREPLLQTKLNNPDSKTVDDSSKTLDKEREIPEQPRPVFPTIESNIDSPSRILSYKKPPRSNQDNPTSKSDKQNSDRSMGSSFLNDLSQVPVEEYSEGSLLLDRSANLKPDNPRNKNNGVEGHNPKKTKELPKNPSNNISKLLAAKYSQHPAAEQKVSREFQYYLGMKNFILPDIIPNEPSGPQNRPFKLIIIGENNHCGGDEYCAGKRIVDNDCNALKSISGCRGMDLTCVVTMIKIQMDALNDFLGTEKKPPNKLSLRVEDAKEIIESIRKEVVRSTDNNEEEYSRKEIYCFISDLLLEKLYANKQISRYFYGLTADIAETRSFQDLDPAIIKKFKKVLVDSYKTLQRAEQK